MNWKMNYLSAIVLDHSSKKDPREELLIALVKLLDLIMPAVIILGGIASVVSFYRAIHYDWYFTLFLTLGLYLAGVLILIFRHRLPVLPMFVICMGFLSVDAFYSLANLGLISIGLMSLTVLCTFAGIFFGLKAGLYSMGCGALTAALIGAGICSGLIPTRPDTGQSPHRPSP